MVVETQYTEGIESENTSSYINIDKSPLLGPVSSTDPRTGLLKLNRQLVAAAFADRYVFDPRSGHLYVFNGIEYVEKPIEDAKMDLYTAARSEGVAGLNPQDVAYFRSNICRQRLSTSMLGRSPSVAYFRDGILELYGNMNFKQRGDPRVFATGHLNTSYSDVASWDMPGMGEPYGAAYLRDMISAEDLTVLLQCIGCFLFDKERRFSPILYIYGKGGSGKSHIGDVVSRILGDRAGPWTLPTRKSSEFNFDVSYKDLLIVDEVKGGHMSEEALTIMKALTSPSDFSVKPKGRENFKISSLEKPMILMTSNDRPDFVLDSGVQRRLRVIRTRDTVIDNETYWSWNTDDFASWLTHEALREYMVISKKDGSDLSMNRTTGSIFDGAEGSILSMYLDDLGYRDRDSVRAYLMRDPTPITHRELLHALQDYEVQALGRDRERVVIRTSMINADLDKLYGLEWYKQYKRYVDVKRRD